MTTKHTPAPWTQGGLKNKDQHWMRSVNSDAIGVAWCGSGDDATAHANARLIAAAPELLEALRAIVSDIKGHPAYADLTPEEEDCEGGDTAFMSWLARIGCAAIAKATGGAE